MQIKVEAIMTDISKPDVGGYDTCKHFKSSERLRDVPVMYLGAFPEIDDHLMAFRVGAVDYMTKPVRAKEVIARIYSTG